MISFSHKKVSWVLFIVAFSGGCASLRIGVALLVEELDDLGLEVALDDDLAILGRATHAAARLEELGQRLEVVVGAHEAADDGRRLASTVVLLYLHAQPLLLRGQGLCFGFLVGDVAVVGVGGVDYLKAAFPIVVFGHMVEFLSFLVIELFSFWGG